MSVDPKAQWLAPSFENIPAELQTQPWAVWKAAPRKGQPGRWNKAPLSPKTGKNIGTDKPELFGTFKDACSAYRRGGYTGVGVLLTGNGIIGVDIDNYEDTFRVLPAVEKWVAVAMAAGAYCEYSPSQTGLRLFMRGKLPGDGRKRGPLEIYDNVRFLTATGVPFALQRTVQ